MNRSSILRQVQSIYSARQHEAKMRTRLVRERFLQEHPDIADMDSAVQEARWSILEAATLPDLADEERLNREKTLESLEQDLENLLKEAEAFRMNANDIYQCTHCFDRGMIQENHVCPYCFGNTLRSVLDTLDIPVLADETIHFEGKKLEFFSDEIMQYKNLRTSPRKLMQQYYTAAESYCDHFPEQLEDFYFSGSTGTGKSHLAACMANAVLQKGYIAIMLSELSVSEIIGKLRTLQRAYSPKPEEMNKAEEQYQLLLEADLLVLDDFGIGTVGLENPLAEIQKLLHERKLRNKATIFTSNVGVMDLRKVYDERLLSRILERFKIWDFIGDDIRIRVRQSKRS